MKLLLDFLPLALFFIVGKYADQHPAWAAGFATEHFGFLVSGGVVGTEEASALLATIVVILATGLQIGWLLLRRKKIELMLWMTFVLVVVLGGATVWFHNASFIKWKPSVLYAAMAAAFWISQSFFGRNLLQAMLGEQVRMPAAVWLRLNQAWIAFFLALGVLNLIVAHTFSTSDWFTFKAFGITGLMIAFTVAQGFYISRHLAPASEAASRPGEP